MFYRREILGFPSKLLINMVGTTGFEPATSSVSSQVYSYKSTTYRTVRCLETPSGTLGNAYCSHRVPTQTNVGNLTATRTSWPPTSFAHYATRCSRAAACESQAELLGAGLQRTL